MNLLLSPILLVAERDDFSLPAMRTLVVHSHMRPTD